MTWTYSGDPASSNKDAVRFLVGDTVETDKLVQDEEIDFALANEGGVTNAAVAICRAVAAKFSRQADKTVGKLSISLSQKAAAYHALADKIEQKASRLAIPYAGGLVVSERESLLTDTSAVQPIFRRGAMDCGS